MIRSIVGGVLVAIVLSACAGSVTIDLTDVEAGSYDFFCEYHPDMKGTLEVTA